MFNILYFVFAGEQLDYQKFSGAAAVAQPTMAITLHLFLIFSIMFLPLMCFNNNFPSSNYAKVINNDIIRGSSDIQQKFSFNRNSCR